MRSCAMFRCSRVVLLHGTNDDVSLPSLRQGTQSERSHHGRVGSRVLRVNGNLMTRRYLAKILKSTPESVDHVILENNGQWHTSDNKYTSQLWHAPTAPDRTPASSKSHLRKAASPRGVPAVVPRRGRDNVIDLTADSD